MMGSKSANRKERDHMGRCKNGPCVACLVLVMIGWLPAEWAQRGGHDDNGMPLPMMEFNHCKSGNMRRGHRYGWAGCPWHHRGIVPQGFTRITARERWGPNLFEEAKAFHDLVGSDDELIEIQQFVLEKAA